MCLPALVEVSQRNDEDAQMSTPEHKVNAPLMVARLICVALIALQLASFLSVAPDYLTLADHPCQTSCALTIERARSLIGAGVSPHVYVAVLCVVVMLSV